MSQVRLGVIGYGRRLQHIVNLIRTNCSDATVVAIADTRGEGIREEVKTQGLDHEAVRIFDDADAMLDSVPLDGVMVGTRCDMHAKLAIKVMKRQIPVFLEKPIATTMADLIALREASRSYRSQAVVSFPLRVSPLVQAVRGIVDTGKIGAIAHVQAINNVPYGSVYFQGWYRDESVTQGLFLQKATHDFDYINFLVQDTPEWVCATTSKQVFLGDRRSELRCRDCGENKTCLQSPFNPGTTLVEDWVNPADRLCAFAVDTGNEDSGSALIHYASGMHVSYSQNFFARNGAAKRGATLIGYLGTLEFDWYTNTINVFMHHSKRSETIKIEETDGHGGGDAVLARNFIDVIRDGKPSITPLSSGLTSALLCLKAKESATTRTFQNVIFPTIEYSDGRRTNGAVVDVTYAKGT